MGSQSCNVVHQDLLLRCVSEVDIARMKAAGAPHAGDCLNAPPITAVGLRLSDEAIRVAVSSRVCHMPTTYLHLWQESECERAARTFMQK